MELLNFSMRGSVLPVKRPPHSLVELPDSWRTQRPTAAPDTATAVAARQNKRAPDAILRMMMRRGVRLGCGCKQRQQMSDRGKWKQRPRHPCSTERTRLAPKGHDALFVVEGVEGRFTGE
jgi:hypothetical protein